MLITLLEKNTQFLTLNKKGSRNMFAETGGTYKPLSVTFLEH